jgi:hypothetical protein
MRKENKTRKIVYGEDFSKTMESFSARPARSLSSYVSGAEAFRRRAPQPTQNQLASWMISPALG